MLRKSPIFWFWFFIIAIFCIPFISECSYNCQDLQANPFDYARITEVDYKAVVVDEPDSQGKVIVTERLTFDIHAASTDNLYWELWRDLPEYYVDGVKVHYQVNSVKQILDDGTEVVYDESSKLYWDDYDYVSSNTMYGPEKWYHSEGPYDEDYDRYECVFFYVDGLYREEVVFEIEYEMYNAALKYNDCSDLYLAPYSDFTINFLESFKGEILFSEEDMPAEGNYEVFTYGTNAGEFRVKESDSMNPGYYTLYFDLDEDDLKFRPYNEYIEFEFVAFDEDKHIFTEYAPSNNYTNDDVLEEIRDVHDYYADATDKYAKIKTAIFVSLSIGAVLVLVYSFTAGSRLKSKSTFFEPAHKMDYYKEIPSDLDPNFAAALVFCKHQQNKNDSAIYSALLLSLARKRYIAIQESGFNDAIITIIKDATKVYEPLTQCEEYYFNLLVRHSSNGSILMGTLQYRVSCDYANTETFSNNMKNSIVNIGIKEGYFQKAEYDKPKKSMRKFAKFLWISGLIQIILVNIICYQTRVDLAYGAFFIMGISCLVSSIYLKNQSNKYVLLTQYGEDEYAKWRGLYNFLKNESQIKDCTITSLPVWEKYLVYATAFGLSEKITNSISFKCPESPTSTNTVFNNSYYRSGRYHHTGRSFHSSVRSGSYSSGGGFSYGGGRGGGGGGGGH